MSGWGEVKKPTQYNVEAPTPAQIREIARRMEQWAIIVADALARIPTDETFTEALRAEMVDEVMENESADKLHAWAEMLERGKAKWVTDAEST